MKNTPLYLWHGSDRAIDFRNLQRDFKPLHLGDQGQAVMRYGEKAFCHLFRLNPGKIARRTDQVGDWRKVIQRGQGSGYDTFRYLNRYEGISIESLERALHKYPQKNFDAIKDREFKSIFPEARDSYIALNPDGLEFIGCFQGQNSRSDARMSHCSPLRQNYDKRPRGELAPFNEWLGKQKPYVIPESAFSFVETNFIEDCRKKLLARYETLDFSAPDVPGLRPQVMGEEGGYTYLDMASMILVIETATGGFAGGITAGTTYVDPAHRGHRIGAFMHMYNDRTRSAILAPTHFSEHGFAIRKAGHRLICERALEDGREVAQVNIEAYDLEDRKAEISRDDFTADAF